MPLELVSKFDEIFPIFATIIEALNGAEPVKDPENSGEPSSSAKAKPSKDPSDSPKRELGGQKGHPGKTIERLEPDKNESLTEDTEKYENDPDWREVKTISRQVVEIESSRKVTEYKVDVYENIKTGKRASGRFPEGIDAPFQYGTSVITYILLLRERGCCRSSGSRRSLILSLARACLNRRWRT